MSYDTTREIAEQNNSIYSDVEELRTIVSRYEKTINEFKEILPKVKKITADY